MPSEPSSQPWPTCPRCRQRLAVFSACPGCGLTLESLDAVYGSEEVVLERVTDPGGALTSAERRAVEKGGIAFESAFPQAWLAVHLGSLGSGPALRQFGFWLLNRATLAGGAITRPNENGVILLLDPEARVSATTVGYQLEPWLPESALESALIGGRRSFREGRMGEGLVEIIRSLATALHDALQAPSSSQPSSRSTSPLDGLRRLRGGLASQKGPQSTDRHAR